MITLADIEREIIDLSDCDYWEEELSEKLRSLARRIAVQIETDRLTKSEAA